MCQVHFINNELGHISSGRYTSGGVVRSGLKHPLAAANDRQERPGRLLCLMQAHSLADVLQKLAEINSIKPLQNLDQHWTLD